MHTHLTRPPTIIQTAPRAFDQLLLALTLAIGVLLGAIVSTVARRPQECTPALLPMPTAVSRLEASLLPVAEVPGSTPAEICLALLARTN